MFQQDYRNVKGGLVPLKMCPHHRKKACERAKTDVGIANRARNRLTEKGKATARAYRQSDKRRLSLKKYNDSKKRRKVSAKYGKTEKGKACSQRAYSAWYQKLKQDGPRLLQHNIRKKIRKVLNGESNSLTMEQMTGLKSDELRRHFESLWPIGSGMSWDNYGDVDDGCWHVGHKIPLSKFDPSDEEDMKRCWNPQNLFPQWRSDNHKQHTSLPPLEELGCMQSVYPKAWGGRVPM